MATIYKIECNGTDCAFVTSRAVAEMSLRLTYHACPGLKITSTISSIVVEREGFAAETFNLIPVELYDQPTHL